MSTATTDTPDTPDTPDASRRPTASPAEKPAPWWRNARGEWYVVVQFTLFAAIALSSRLWPGLSAWPTAVARVAGIVGLALMLSGGALAVWGLVALGSNNLTALPYPKDEATLTVTGPYAIVRNPIYSGLLLGATGLGLWHQSWVTLLLSAGLFVLFDLKTRREQAWLTERFPEYSAYARRVKKLVPWVY